jgi:hypothetical protein
MNTIRNLRASASKSNRLDAALFMGSGTVCAMRVAPAPAVDIEIIGIVVVDDTGSSVGMRFFGVGIGTPGSGVSVNDGMACGPDSISAPTPVAAEFGLATAFGRGIADPAAAESFPVRPVIVKRAV